MYRVLGVAVLGAMSPEVLACTACFGKSDSNMAKGMNMGIFVLLLVIISVLCGVASFFVFLAKRSHQLEETGPAGRFSQNGTNA